MQYECVPLIASMGNSERAVINVTWWFCSSFIVPDLAIPEIVRLVFVKNEELSVIDEGFKAHIKVNPGHTKQNTTEKPQPQFPEGANSVLNSCLGDI